MFEPPPFAELVTVRFPTEAHWVTECVDVELTAEYDTASTAVVTSVGAVRLERLLVPTGGKVIDPTDMVGRRPRATRRLLAVYTA